MAGKIVLLDTSILIDYFRKKDKTKTRFYQLADEFQEYKISAVTEYEIYYGTSLDQKNYWKVFLEHIAVLPFDSLSAETAVDINNQLKKSSNQIATADLFIAATALANNLPCATLNKKHFDRIDSLKVI